MGVVWVWHSVREVRFEKLATILLSQISLVISAYLRFGLSFLVILMLLPLNASEAAD